MCRERALLFVASDVDVLIFPRKYVRSQTTSLVLFGFEIDQQITIWNTGSILVCFYRKLPTARVHLSRQRGKLTDIAWVFEQN